MPESTSKTLESWFLDYEQNHQNPTNKKIHQFAIPAVMLSTLGLLSFFGINQTIGQTSVRIDLSQALIFLASLWYIKLNFRLGIPFIFVGIGIYALSRSIPTSVHLALFVVSWIFQLIGHSRYEKKSPKFLENLRHLLIGPLWVFNNLVKTKE